MTREKADDILKYIDKNKERIGAMFTVTVQNHIRRSKFKNIDLDALMHDIKETHQVIRKLLTNTDLVININRPDYMNIKNKWCSIHVYKDAKLVIVRNSIISNAIANVNSKVD